MRLILASASPRRAELLRAAGFEFEIAARSTSTRRSGRAKRRRCTCGGWRWRNPPGAREWSGRSGPVRRPDPTYGSATQRTSDDVVVSRPTRRSSSTATSSASRATTIDAAAMLRRLSGRRHEVLTGVSLRRSHTWSPAPWPSESKAATDGRWFVERRSSSEHADVTWYVASGEGRDKAGAYAIQGLASRFIPRIKGRIRTSSGLPVAAVAWRSLARDCIRIGQSGYSQR